MKYRFCYTEETNNTTNVKSSWESDSDEDYDFMVAHLKKIISAYKREGYDAEPIETKDLEVGAFVVKAFGMIAKVGDSFDRKDITMSYIKD